MKIRWLGNAGLCIDEKIMIDPFIELKGSKNRLPQEVYETCDHILVTHGHIDHIASIPLLSNKPQVYCTKTPYLTLKNKGVENLHLICNQDTFILEGIKVTVYHSRHVQFDFKLIIETLFSFRMFRYAYNLPYIYKENRVCKENQETVAYYLEGDRKILVFGSMGYDSEVIYPKKVDVLILPYQGSSHLKQLADELITMIEPKAVMVDHFDDAFPPISKDVKIEIDALIPLIDQTIEI